MYGIASGMTIKFFPLFFKNEMNLSPVMVNSVYCAGPLVMALLSVVNQKISLYIGRLETVCITNIIGEVCVHVYVYSVVVLIFYTRFDKFNII